MKRFMIVAMLLMPLLASAQFITDDANAILHVYWNQNGTQDTKSNTWEMEGSVSLASSEFGYAAGVTGFTATDFIYNGSNEAQPSWDPPYSIMDFTADECAYDPWICGSPTFTGVLAFKNTGGTTNPGVRFLLSTQTWGDGNGWHISTESIAGVGGRERIVRFYADGLFWPTPPRAQDTNGLIEGEGLQILCFGITEGLEPALKANGRTMMIGPAGDWQNLCDPPVEDPACYAAFMPSYGPGYLGIHDGFGDQWRPALFKTYYEFYMTRTPITDELCSSLAAEIIGE